MPCHSQLTTAMPATALGIIPPGVRNNSRGRARRPNMKTRTPPSSGSQHLAVRQRARPCDDDLCRGECHQGRRVTRPRSSARDRHLHRQRALDARRHPYCEMAAWQSSGARPQTSDKRQSGGVTVRCDEHPDEALLRPPPRSLTAKVGAADRGRRLSNGGGPRARTRCSLPQRGCSTKPRPQPRIP
jgi:hypothetical protein